MECQTPKFWFACLHVFTRPQFIALLEFGGGLKEILPRTAPDRGRDGALICSTPPSEPDGRISRIRLSS